MALLRFTLDDVAAFRNMDRDVAAEHFCVGCAPEATAQFTLVPFLDGQLSDTLSDLGKDAGAMMSCDQCGQVIATHCPATLWAGHKEHKEEVASPVLFRKF